MGHHEFYHVGGNIRMFNLEVFLGVIAGWEVQFFRSAWFENLKGVSMRCLKAYVCVSTDWEFKGLRQDQDISGWHVSILWANSKNHEYVYISTSKYKCVTSISRVNPNVHTRTAFIWSILWWQCATKLEVLEPSLPQTDWPKKPCGKGDARFVRWCGGGFKNQHKSPKSMSDKPWFLWMCFCCLCKAGKRHRDA